MNSKIFEVGASGFEEAVLRNPEPVVVAFRANWCSLCKALEPMLKSLADEKFGDIKFATVDIEKNEGLADQFSIRAIPTLLIFHQGSMADRIVGRITELELRNLLGSFL
jgi:thioredoxin 1